MQGYEAIQVHLAGDADVSGVTAAVRGYQHTLLPRYRFRRSRRSRQELIIGYAQCQAVENIYRPRPYRPVRCIVHGIGEVLAERASAGGQIPLIREAKLPLEP
jgi:hypothetical protein